MIFFTPVCNLKDFEPLLSKHMKRLSKKEAIEWERLSRAGETARSKGNWPEAQRYFHQADDIDATYADTLFRLGESYLAQGDFLKAKTFFEKARDNDGFIIRATSDIIDVIRKLPRSDSLEVIDTESVIIGEIPSGILGKPMFIDSVHFSLRGHAMVGRAVAERLASLNWIAPAGAWQWNRQRSYDEMQKELGIQNELLFSVSLRMVNFSGDRYEDSIEFAKQAITLKPEDPRGYRALAWTYWLMGKKTEALNTYGQLKKIDPESVDAVMKKHPEIKRLFG